MNVNIALTHMKEESRFKSPKSAGKYFSSILFLLSETPEIRKGGSERNPAPALEAKGIRNVLFLILRENPLVL